MHIVLYNDQRQLPLSTFQPHQDFRVLKMQHELLGIQEPERLNVLKSSTTLNPYAF